MKLGYMTVSVIYMIWQVMHLLRDIDKPRKAVVLEYMSNMLFPSRLETIYIHQMTFLNSIFIEAEWSVFNKHSNFLVGVIYRPPNTDIICFNESLNIILDKLKCENKLCFLMGVYNINLLNNDKHTPTSDFVELMHSHSFLSLIIRPTRITLWLIISL